MKNFIYGALLGVLLLIPAFAYSAPSLASRLQGRILLAVEDKGKTYYVAPDGHRYRITASSAHTIFEKLALGISDKDLDAIPEGDVGVDPEAVRIEERVVYVDKQCDVSSYTDKIADLKNEVALLRSQIDALGKTEPETEVKDAIRREYGLKINDLSAELLEIQFIERNLDNVAAIFKPEYDPTLWDTKFKRDIVSGIIDLWNDPNTPKTVSTTLRSFAKEYLVGLKEERNIEITRLRNELERKLLE